MQKGKHMDEWLHTATICATIRNLLISEKEALINPMDLHPYAAEMGFKSKRQSDDPSTWSEERKQFEAEMRAAAFKKALSEGTL